MMPNKKIALSNPNWLDLLDIPRDLESQDREGIWNRQVGHGKGKDHESRRDLKRAANVCKRRFPKQ